MIGICLTEHYCPSILAGPYRCFEVDSNDNDVHVSHHQINHNSSFTAAFWFQLPSTNDTMRDNSLLQLGLDNSTVLTVALLGDATELLLSVCNITDTCKYETENTETRRSLWSQLSSVFVILLSIFALTHAYSRTLPLMLMHKYQRENDKSPSYIY